MNSKLKNLFFAEQNASILFNEIEIKNSIVEKDFQKIKINSHSTKGLFLTLGIQKAGILIR